MAEESILDKAARWVAELTESGDYSTPTKARDNKVKQEPISTYKGSPDGQGAAENAADEIRARHKMLRDL